MTTRAPSAARSGGRSMCGSACASAPPTVATLRTRTLESVRSVRVITVQPFFTASDFSSARSVVIAPMRSSPFASILSKPSLRRLTNRLGRSTPAFIISMSAVPPESGRASSASRSALASCRLCGSASSNGAIARTILSAPPGRLAAFVFEHDSLIEQLLADAIGGPPVLALARGLPLGDFFEDPPFRDASRLSLQECDGLPLQEAEHAAEALQLRGQVLLAAVDLVRELEKHCHRFRRAEVIVHRLFEALGIRRAPIDGRGSGEILERGVEASERVLGIVQIHVRVIDRAAVVRAQDEKAHHLRVVALEHIAHREEVSERLGHLRFVDLDEGVVHPVVDEAL